MGRRDSPGFVLLVVGALIVSAFALAVRQSTLHDSGVCKVPPATFHAPPTSDPPIGPGQRP